MEHNVHVCKSKFSFMHNFLSDRITASGLKMLHFFSLFIVPCEMLRNS